MSYGDFHTTHHHDKEDGEEVEIADETDGDFVNSQHHHHQHQLGDTEVGLGLGVGASYHHYDYQHQHHQLGDTEEDGGGGRQEEGGRGRESSYDDNTMIDEHNLGKSDDHLLNPFTTDDSEFPDFVDVSIPDYEVRISPFDNETFTVYRIELHYGNMSKQIYKRFKQFHTLHYDLKLRAKKLLAHSLRSKIPSSPTSSQPASPISSSPHSATTHNLPTFPAKAIFNMDNNVVKERRKQLESYLRELLTIPGMFKAFELTLFLEMIDLTGKVCIITGPMTKIGQQVAMTLAHLGAHIILASDLRDSIQTLIKRIKEETGNNDVESIDLDMSSFSSIRRFVSRFHNRHLPLTLLINQPTGISSASGLSKDRFEINFATNYLGYFLLTSLLLDDLKHSAPSRIVNVTPSSHFEASTLDLQAVREPLSPEQDWKAELRWSSAFLLFTCELAHRLQNSRVSVNHVISNAAWSHLPQLLSWVKNMLMADEEGAKTLLYCALAPEMEAISGNFYDEFKKQLPTRDYLNQETLMKELWEESEKWVGLVNPNTILDEGDDGNVAVPQHNIVEKEEEHEQQQEQEEEEDISWTPLPGRGSTGQRKSINSSRHDAEEVIL